jgi:hypothetical protein
VVVAIGWTYIDAREAKKSAATASAFIEEMVFEDAVRACALVETPVPFRYREAKQKVIVGLRSMVLPAISRTIPYYRLYADGQVCDYQPLGKHAEVGIDEADFWDMFGDNRDR